MEEDRSMDKNDRLVWYVAYGSNLQEERFMRYINGDCDRKGCNDKTPPRKSIPVIIPGERYFAKSSSRWQNKGVAFYDWTADGEIRGRAWLITEDQFCEIKAQEGGWYEEEIEFCPINGIPARTFTHDNSFRREINHPSKEYELVVQSGEAETLRLPMAPIKIALLNC